MRVQRESNGALLSLEGDPLGSGGEADVYALPDRPQQVAKIYRRPTPAHADKLEAMIARPPKLPPAAGGHASIAWPEDRLLAADGSRTVVGYVMPRVQKSLLFQQVQHPKARQSLAPNFNSLYLLRTGRNLAAAVQAIHDAGHVVGDLNESNIFVTAGALVTLVDTDSFQVASAGQVFRCRVGKLEYTPPELQFKNLADIDRVTAHDNFGLAVLLFQLLMQGVHPFGGAYTADDSLCGGLGDWIAKGWWPYSLDREVPFQPRPAAPPWDVLPPQVQTLFLRCFDTGHTKPGERPSAREWNQALTDAEAQLQECTANRQHFYPRQAETCPWCRMAKEQGRDPFPLPQPAAAPTPPKAAPPAPVSNEPVAPRRGRPVGCLLGLLVMIAAAFGYWNQRDRLDPVVRGWFARSDAAPTAPGPQTPPSTSPVVAGVFFNGKNTDGWDGLPDHWKVQDGALVGSSSPNGLFTDTYLCSRKKYRDFELKFQARLKGNKAGSGVAIRGQLVDPKRFLVRGPLAHIGEGGTPSAQPFSDYAITCVGKHLTVKVNGAAAVDRDFPDLPEEGIIAWQLRAGPEMEVTFRNIEFTESPPLAVPVPYVSLFNGKDLTGWKLGPTDKCKWEVKDHILIGSGAPGCLYSQRDDYENFYFRIEARINERGNSGQFFRGRYPLGARPQAYEAQIALTDTQKTGSLYDIVKIAESLHKPDEWFTQEVRADGDHIVILFNGKKVVDTHDKSFLKGHLALQVHGNGTVVQFRRIEIREYPPGSGDSKGATAADTEKAKALVKTGRELRNHGDLAKAIQTFDEAIQLDPKLANAYTNRGIAYQKQLHYDRAIAEYNRALDLDSRELWALSNRGYCFRMQHAYDLAFADYDCATRFKDRPTADMAVVYTGRGLVRKATGHVDPAIADYTEAIRLDPHYFWGHFDRGIAYRDQKNYDQAIADLGNAIQHAPRSQPALAASAHDNRGWVFQQKKDYDAAIADFTKAILLDPKSIAPYYNRGYAYRDKAIRDKTYGLYDQAITDFTSALALNPKSTRALDNRGWLYYAKKDYARAIPDFDQAIELATKAIRANPKNQEERSRLLNAYRNRGLTHETKGETDQAIDDFSQIIKLDPRNAQAYQDRSRLHAKKGDKSQADADHAKAVQLNPKLKK